jgi:hypothetical protein
MFRRIVTIFGEGADVLRGGFTSFYAQASHWH